MWLPFCFFKVFVCPHAKDKDIRVHELKWVDPPLGTYEDYLKGHPPCKADFKPILSPSRYDISVALILIQTPRAGLLRATLEMKAKRGDSPTKTTLLAPMFSVQAQAWLASHQQRAGACLYLKISMGL